MKKNRKELAELLQVSEKYLCPSNFNYVKQGAKRKGYNLISMTGKGKKAIYEIEPFEDVLEGEVWKEIPNTNGYQASSLGRIKNPFGGILQGTNSKGYLRTRIQNMGQPLNHRLVMMAFQPIENMEMFAVDHINGIKTDNRVENLRWVFQSENMYYCDKNNTQLKEILAKLVQKYGYEETVFHLKQLLEAKK